MGNRREGLISTIKNLDAQGIGCSNCSGVCCTYVANSMQTTPIETKELYDFLSDENRVNDNLVEKLKETIKRYRLDQDLFHHKKALIRRTYTCPFFKDQSLGCSIAPESKPYGCLGFNAKVSGVKDGENCGSNIELLIKREQQNIEFETLKNNKIKKELNLEWDKKAMPVALLEYIEKLEANDHVH